MPHIRCLICATFVSLAAVAGCQSSLGRPDKAWVNDLARTDTIELRSGNFSARLTEPAEIDRMRDIYSNEHWEKYWHTLPADVADRKIVLWADGHELRQFSYTGTLWEMGASDDIRTARLDSDDRKWLASLFADLRTVDDSGEPSD